MPLVDGGGAETNLGCAAVVLPLEELSLPVDARGQECPRHTGFAALYALRAGRPFDFAQGRLPALRRCRGEFTLAELRGRGPGAVRL